MTLYWLTVLLNFKDVINDMGFMLFTFSCLGGFGLAVYIMEGGAVTFNFIKRILIIVIMYISIRSITYTFIPNKEQIATILAGNYLLDNKEAQKLPDNLLRYINSLLEKRP